MQIKQNQLIWQSQENLHPEMAQVSTFKPFHNFTKLHYQFTLKYKKSNQITLQLNSIQNLNIFFFQLKSLPGPSNRPELGAHRHQGPFRTDHDYINLRRNQGNIS